MEEPQQQQQNLRHDEEATIVVGGEEATLVSPRFDDEEALVARPVVPLEEPPADAQAVAAATPAARWHYAPRRQWPLALMLVSVLIGGVLGGAGLYLFQRQSQDEAGASAPAAEAPSAVEAQQQPPASAPQAEAEAAPTEPQPEAPAEEAPAAAAAQAPEPADEQTTAPADAQPARTPEREPETVPASGRRDEPEAAAPKRGKKGERDAELNRRAVSPDAEVPVSRAYDPADDAPRARRVDAINYRQQRRAERRTERRARREAAGADRLRRIFEGMPE